MLVSLSFLFVCSFLRTFRGLRERFLSLLNSKQHWKKKKNFKKWLILYFANFTSRNSPPIPNNLNWQLRYLNAMFHFGSLWIDIWRSAQANRWLVGYSEPLQAHSEVGG
jgi:hypothetical protein